MKKGKKEEREGWKKKEKHRKKTKKKTKIMSKRDRTKIERGNM